MLEYNEIRERKFIVFDGEPYEVIASHVFRKQQRKPVNQTKLKNLITGKVMEQSFHSSEKVEEADLESKEVKYLYASRGEYWFCDKDNASNRFKLDEALLQDKIKYVKQNDLVELLSFRDTPIGLSIPIKVRLKVTEAAPAVKGNTVQGGNKQITLETGATINVPMFINEGDIIEINTDTGEYTNRV